MAGPTLGQLCLQLRNANPEAWDGFIRSFSDYTHEAMIAMAESPADKILVMQGRVNQCQALLRLFKECDAPSRKPAP